MATRVLGSASIAIWSAESTTASEDTDVLNALDSDDTALLRRDVSVESAAEMEPCELKSLVANAVSGPISVFKLVSVSMDDVKLLIAPIVEVKKGSVASAFELYWG